MKHFKRILMNRKIVAVILAAAMVVSAAAFTPTILPNIPIVSNMIGNPQPDFSAPAKNAVMPGFRCGDTTGEGKVEIFDVLEVLKVLIKMTSTLNDTKKSEDDRLLARRASLLAADSRKGVTTTKDPTIFDALEILKSLIKMKNALCEDNGGCDWCNACLVCSPFPGTGVYPNCGCGSTSTTTAPPAATTVAQTEAPCPGANTNQTCQFIPWCNPCSRTECTLRACEHPAVRTCDSGNTDCQKLGCEDACKPRVCEKSTPGCNIYECQHACYQICFTEDCINPWSCQPDCECLCDGPCGTKPPHALCEGECNTRLCAINLANPRDHAFQTHMIEGATITCTLRECQSDCELRTDCKGVPKCTRYTCQGACDCQPPSTNAAATTDTAPETTVTTPNATATVETTDGTTSAIDTTVIETTTEDMTTNTTIATTEEDVATTSSPSNTTTIGTGTAAATTTTPAATTTTPTPTTTTPGTTTTPTPTTLYYCPVPPGCIACPFGPAGMGAEWDEVCESEICANPICANFDCTCSGSTGQRPEFIGMPVAESRKSGDKNDEPFLEKCHYAGCAKPAATQELCPGCGYCRDCDWYYFGTVHCTGCQFGSDCIAQAQCNHSSCIKALDGLLIGICVNPETPQRHGPRNDWCGQHAMCIGCCPDPNVDGKFGGRITYKGFSMVKPEDLGVRGCVFSDKVSGVLHESCKSPNDLVTCNVCAGNRVEMCVSCTAVRYGVVICRGCSRHSDCISGLQNGSRTDGWCEECGLCKVVIPPALESCCDKSGVH